MDLIEKAKEAGFLAKQIESLTNDRNWLKRQSGVVLMKFRRADDIESDNSNTTTIQSKEILSVIDDLIESKKIKLANLMKD